MLGPGPVKNQRLGKIAKLENQRLEQENELMQQKIEEMATFVQAQKQKDRERKLNTKNPVESHAIRGKIASKGFFNVIGIASKIVTNHQQIT
jgi:hypothetical protein